MQGQRGLEDTSSSRTDFKTLARTALPALYVLCTLMAHLVEAQPSKQIRPTDLPSFTLALPLTIIFNFLYLSAVRGV